MSVATITFIAWFLTDEECCFPLNRVFTSVRKVLQGACHMVSLQLAAEPLVRQAVRQVFQTRALLNVKPTKKGKKVYIQRRLNYVFNTSGS